MKDCVSIEAIAGSIAGLFQVASTQPFDTIKTLSQSNIKLTYKGDSWRTVTRRSHLWLFRGTLYQLLYRTTTKALFFDISTRISTVAEITGVQHQVPTWVTGGITGLLTAPVGYTFDIFKIKVQTAHSRVNIKDFLNYNSLVSSFARDIPGYALYLQTYTLLRKKDYTPFTAGALSGVTTLTMIYPIDTVRTRLIETNTLTIRDAINQSKLYRGITPALIRAAVSSAVGFSVYEHVIEFLNTK